MRTAVVERATRAGARGGGWSGRDALPEPGACLSCAVGGAVWQWACRRVPLASRVRGLERARERPTGGVWMSECVLGRARTHTATQTLTALEECRRHLRTVGNLLAVTAAVEGAEQAYASKLHALPSHARTEEERLELSR